jgi:hypothetical protein
MVLCRDECHQRILIEQQDGAVAKQPEKKEN